MNISGVIDENGDVNSWVPYLYAIDWEKESIKEFMEKVISKNCQLDDEPLQKAVELGWDMNELGKYYDEKNTSSKDPQYFFKDGLCTPFMAICRNKNMYNNIINVMSFFSKTPTIIKCYNKHNDYFDMSLLEILFLSNLRDSDVYYISLEMLIEEFNVTKVIDFDTIDRYIQLKIKSEYI